MRNKILMLLIILTLLVSGCTKPVKEQDMIIKVDTNNLVKVSEEVVLSFSDKAFVLQ